MTLDPRTDMFVAAVRPDAILARRVGNLPIGSAFIPEFIFPSASIVWWKRLCTVYEYALAIRVSAIVEFAAYV